MNNEPKAGPGIDPEMLAAYIDHRLTPEQRAVVEAQLAKDPEGYELLANTLKALDDETIGVLEVAEPRQVPKSPAVPFVPKAKRAPMVRWAIAGGVLAAAAAIVLVVRVQPEWLQRLRGDDVDPMLARLVQAVGDERRIEPRLTGGFRHAPVLGVTRGGAITDNLALVAAAGELQQQAAVAPTFGNLHGWGVAAILVGRFDEGVVALEQASALAPSDARVLADLSGAYLARAQAMNRAEDLPRALAAADRALRIDDALLEARFNRALSLELLHLVDQADQAWRDYADRDPSAWGDEARRRSIRPRASAGDQEWQDQVAAAERPQSDLRSLVQRFPERTLKLGEFEWPGRWAAAVLARDSAQQRHWLARLQELGAALEASIGDPIVARFAAFATSADASTTAVVVTDYVAARRLAEDYRFLDAARALAAVADRMQAQANPLAVIALLESGGAFRSARQIDQVVAILPRILDGAQPYPSARAKAHRLAGLVEVARGHYTDALSEYGLAIDGFRSAGLHLTESQTSILIAEALRVVGSKELWNYQALALRTAELGATPRELQPVFFTAGVSSLLEDLPEAAVYFFDAMIAEAEKVGVSAAIAEARLSRARAYLMMNEPAGLEADLAAANQLLDSSEASPHAEFVRGEWGAVRAEQLARLDPPAAIAASESALAYATRTRRSSLIPRVRLAQGRALAILGRRAEAASAFEAGITAFEGQWANVAQDALRVSYFDRAWDLYGDLASLRAEMGETSEALATLERSQARSLLAARNRPGREWSQVRLESALRPDAAVIYWMPAERLTYAWIVRRSGTRMFSVPIGRAEISRVPSDSIAALQRLGTRLIEPLAPLLADTAAIGFVAPARLSQVPWASVQLPSGQSLIDTSSVQLLPNALIALNSAEASFGDARVLVVAAGSDLRDGIVKLPDLPRAQEEATAVASNYRHATLLVNQAATPADVTRGWSTHSIFHFAGHAVSNEATPELSRLVLSNGAAISARDLQELDSASVKLAVLTACSTASGAIVRSEGSLGIARMLLSKGVEAVIATLYPVSDLVASRFGTLFHERLARGLSVGHALQETQRALKSDGRFNDNDWSGFVLVGGSGLFFQGRKSE